MATTGRPGPVLLDIPMDLQRQKININKLKSFTPKIEKSKILKKKLNFIIKKIIKSKKPVIILGGGIKYAKAEKNLNKFLRKFNIPIVTTWSGVDLVDHSNKNYIGNIGVYGSRSANFAVQNSDLILSLGSRLDTRVTGGVPKNFARNAEKIVVDIDKNELNKEDCINYKINLNVKYFLNQINKFNFKKISKMNG